MNFQNTKPEKELEASRQQKYITYKRSLISAVSVEKTLGAETQRCNAFRILKKNYVKQKNYVNHKKYYFIKESTYPMCLFIM